MKRVIIHLLHELGVLNRCKRKSIKSFEQTTISEETHEKHLENLNPLIDEFEEAITVLKEVKNR